MRRPTHWTVLETEALQDCRVFSISGLRSQKAGAEEIFTFFRIDSSDWTNIIPLTDDGHVVMIRQFRHGLGGEILEIPGGLVDPGEEPEPAAARELLEETGYRPRTITKIGAVNPNPALFGNRLHSFLAEGCTRVAEVQCDRHEETIVELVPIEEIPARMRAGEIDHALVLTAFYWLGLRNE
jgi:8-oxo-dGTP pyrophosphatase MutT (NUDIX family)